MNPADHLASRPLRSAALENRSLRHRLTRTAASIAFALLSPLAASAQAGPYLVVMVDIGAADAGFRDAAAAAARHHAAEVVRWDGRDWPGLTRILTRHHPENVLFVLEPETLDINLHRQILLRAATLDDDPFVDFAFGYLTGSSGVAAVALWQRIAKLHEHGLRSHRWIASSITSSERSLEYRDSLPPIAKQAGFEGAHYYPSIHDPEQSAFVARVLGELPRAAVIQFTGNGDPQGIWLFDDQRNIDHSKHWAYAPDKVGHDPDGAMPRIMADQFRSTRLDSPIIWSGTCHSAATCRVFVAGDIVSTFGRTEVDTAHCLTRSQSLALAWLDAGCAGLLAPIAANHGMSVSMETDFALRHGASLGEAVKSTWDDVFLAADGQLRLDIAEVGTPQGRDGYVMQGGGANRILIGDPALRPFATTASPSESVSVEKSALGLTVIVDRKKGFEPRAWDIYGTDRTADWRVITRVELTDLLPEEGDRKLSASVRATGPDGTAMPFRPSRCAVEDFHGRRYLHLQANAPRDEVQGKAVRVRFEVTVQ